MAAATSHERSGYDFRVTTHVSPRTKTTSVGNVHNRAGRSACFDEGNMPGQPSDFSQVR